MAVPVVNPYVAIAYAAYQGATWLQSGTRNPKLQQQQGQDWLNYAWEAQTGFLTGKMSWEDGVRQTWNAVGNLFGGQNYTRDRSKVAGKYGGYLADTANSDIAQEGAYYGFNLDTNIEWDTDDNGDINADEYKESWENWYNNVYKPYEEKIIAERGRRGEILEARDAMNLDKTQVTTDLSAVREWYMNGSDKKKTPKLTEVEMLG